VAWCHDRRVPAAVSTRSVGRIKDLLVTGRRQRFPARMEAFAALAAFADGAGRDAGFGRDDVLRLRLILEELFTNTVRHGHGGDSDQPVDVVLDVTPGQIRLTYEDTAAAFDPRTPPPQGPAEERPVGQLGLVLVRSMARELSYERIAGRNRLTFLVSSSLRGRA
jgi:anti-sigma regulatory factor (Ser/Thr protein kinase)